MWGGRRRPPACSYRSDNQNPQKPIKSLLTHFFHPQTSPSFAIPRSPYNFLYSNVDEVIVRLTSFALAALLLLITPVLSVPSFSQNSGQAPAQIPGLSSSPSLPPDERDNPERAKLERELAKKVNRERQAQLQRDTDNLLKLATQLKQYVDKSNENTLSLDVVKKAEEIEKLAHSVKEKMKAN
jgi:hypothetical protein